MEIVKMNKKNLDKWIEKLEFASQHCLPENQELFDKWLSEAKVEKAARRERRENYLRRKGL